MNVIRINLLFLALFFLFAGGAREAYAMTYAEQMAALTKEKADSEAAVKVIVNQPVQSYAINTFSLLEVASPGWFHAGASPPNYDTDIRKTQEFPYKASFVTSDVTPGIMFKSSDIEFNKNLKYYYTDRNLPKKKLTPQEMAEIGRLYHIIGNDNKKMEEMQGFVYSTSAKITEFFGGPAGTVIQLAVLSLVGFVVYRKWFA